MTVRADTQEHLHVPARNRQVPSEGCLSGGRAAGRGVLPSVPCFLWRRQAAPVGGGGRSSVAPGRSSPGLPASCSLRHPHPAPSLRSGQPAPQIPDSASSLSVSAKVLGDKRPVIARSPPNPFFYSFAVSCCGQWYRCPAPVAIFRAATRVASIRFPDGLSLF